MPSTFDDLEFELMARWGGVDMWAFEARGAKPRRIVTYSAYGRDGADTSDTGREPRRDTITAKLSYADYKRLDEAVDKGEVKVFTHPIFGTYQARANIVSYSLTGNEVSIGTEKTLVNVEIEFTEDTAQPLAEANETETVESKASEVSNAFGDVDEAYEDNSVFDDDDETSSKKTTLDSTYSTWEDKYELYQDGTATWEDLNSATNDIKAASIALSSVLGAYTTYVEPAYQMQNSLALLCYNAHRLIEVATQEQELYFPLVLQSAADVYSLCLAVYGSTSPASDVIEKNAILDPFFIPSGELLTMPVVS